MLDKPTRKLVYRRDDLVAFGIDVSNSTLLRWEATGRFPPRIRMGGTVVAWPADEVDQWFEDQRAQRPAKPKFPTK